MREPSKLFLSAMKFLNAGEFQKAIEEFTQAIASKERTEEELAAAHCNRAISYSKLEIPVEAIKDFTQAINSKHLTKKMLAQAYYGRGRASLVLGNLVEAIKNFTQAIDSNELAEGELAVVQLCRGYAKEKGKQYGEAIPDLTSAIDSLLLSAEQLIMAYESRRVCYDGLEQYEEAISELKQLIELEPPKQAHYSELMKEMAQKLIVRIEKQFPSTKPVVSMNAQSSGEQQGVSQTKKRKLETPPFLDSLRRSMASSSSSTQPVQPPSGNFQVPSTATLKRK